MRRPVPLMGWVTDDGRHEGYLLPEFADGQRGIGVTTGAVSADQVIVELREFDAAALFVTRPASEVIGWRAMCDCRSEHSGLLPESDRWTSELVVRIATENLQDIAAGRIFTADSDVANVAERDDVGEAVRELWWREHAGRWDALSRIERARARLVAASRELNDAVAIAYAAGADAQAINRSAGVRPTFPSPGTSRPRRGGPKVGMEGWTG